MLALFLHLQLNVHRAGLHVLLQFRVFRLDRLEITQLVQAQKAQFPVAVVEDLPLVQQQLAADHFVARRGVAGKFDAPDEKLLLLVEHERQVHDFLCVVHIEIRLGRKVDVAILAVQLGEAFQRFADSVGVENVAFLQRKGSCEQFGLENQPLIRVGTAEGKLAHVVLLALRDGNRDVGCFPVPVSN